jgi:hypothetical protein
MKRVVGHKHDWEGDRMRKFSVIECSECGAQTFERRSGRVQRALKLDCRSCERIHQREARENKDPFENLDYDCGVALLRSLQNIKKLNSWLREDQRWKHGLYLRPEYKAWHNMVSRCYNPQFAHYADYGGRGITVCDEWREDPWMFLLHMGPRPSNEHSVDRIDNEYIYCPENCKWSTQAEQNANRRDPIQNKLPWWRLNFGLYVNPLVYGPMPWKKTSHKFRREEAIANGWIPYTTPTVDVRTLEKASGDTRNAPIKRKPLHGVQRLEGNTKNGNR